MKHIQALTILAAITSTTLAALPQHSQFYNEMHRYGLHYNVGTQLTYGFNNADSGADLSMGASFLRVFSASASVSDDKDSSNGKAYQKTKLTVGAAMPTKISPYVLASVYRYYNDNKSKVWQRELDGGLRFQLTEKYSFYGEWDSPLAKEVNQNFEVGASYGCGSYIYTLSVDAPRNNYADKSLNLGLQFHF